MSRRYSGCACNVCAQSERMIGNMLHYSVRGKEVYDTLLRCSEDGEQIFSSKFNGAEGKFLTAEADWLDALSLLSLGFGKAL